MVELNQQINWVPEHVRDGAFGKWLEGARDWSITPQPLLGDADPGLEERRPALPAHRRLRQPRRARARLRRAARRPAPPGHRRADPPEPGRPDRAVDDAAGPATSSTAGSSPARCRSPRCTTPSRTRSGSRSTSRPTSSSSTSARPAAGSTPCTCSSTALFDRPPFKTCIAHGIVLGDDGRKLSKRLRNFPDPEEVFAALRAPTPCGGTCSPRRCCGARTSSSRRRRSPSRSATCCNPIWNTLVLPLALRQRRRDQRASSAPTRPACSTATCSPRPAASSSDVTAAMDAYDLAGRLPAIVSLPRRAHQLVRAPQPGPLLAAPRRRLGRAPDAGQARRLRHLCTPLVDALPGRGAAPPASQRGGLPGADRRAQRPPRRLARRRTSCPPTPTLVAAMDLVREVCSAGHSIRKATTSALGSRFAA